MTKHKTKTKKTDNTPIWIVRTYAAYWTGNAEASGEALTKDVLGVKGIGLMGLPDLTAAEGEALRATGTAGEYTTPVCAPRGAPFSGRQSGDERVQTGRSMVDGGMMMGANECPESPEKIGDLTAKTALGTVVASTWRGGRVAEGDGLLNR